VSKDWRTILRFEILGLAITVFFFMFDRVDFITKSWIEGWIFLASLVACPGYFLSSLTSPGAKCPCQTPRSRVLSFGYSTLRITQQLGSSTSTCGSRVAAWLKS